jgi:hypothetical protein
MDPPPRLDRRLRVGTDDHVAGLEQLALPAPRVQVKHPPGLLQKIGVAGEDPRTVLPRFDRILGEPAADRRRRRVATPRSTTNRCNSERLKRESGTPCFLGSSHAIALTSATCSGADAARATRAFPITQPAKTLVVKALSPTTHKLGHHLQTGADLNIAQLISRVQNKLGALHLPMRPRIARRAMLQLGPLLLAQHDPIPAATRHRQPNSLQSP